MPDQIHTWEQQLLNTKNKKRWSAVFFCTNGECNCEKYIDHKGKMVWQRSEQVYSHEPECYGDIPLDKQPIDY